MSLGGGETQTAILEICVESVAGAAAAVAGGCDRIELCSALALGGLTPSAGLVEGVLAVTAPAGIPVRAMVRPRPGGFDYDADDLALALAEARTLIAAGVQGLVFGASADGGLAREALAEWRDGLGADIGLTLHRVVDVLDDPVAAVEDAVALGFDRVLTSGGATNALAGAETIARMFARAGGRCAIIAGAGVSPANVAALIAATSVREVHGSASEAVPQPHDAFGFGPMPRRTSASIVAALRQAVDDKSNIRQL